MPLLVRSPVRATNAKREGAGRLRYLNREEYEKLVTAARVCPLLAAGWGMEGSKHYPVEIYCPRRRRLVRARWKASEGNWSEAPFRIIGQPEMRAASGGGTAGHVARGAKE